MAATRLAVGQERGTRWAFVWALDWPGWCRAGKTPELAVEAFVAAAPRYAVVAQQARLELGDVTPDALEVIDTVEGGGATDFGVPAVITASDRRPVTAAEAVRLAGLVGAA